MGVTLTEIDQLLTDWKQKIDIANQNLLALSDLPTYQRVMGMGNPPTNLAGITQQKISKALTAIDYLFDNLTLLTQTVDRAKQLRQELPILFISDDRLQEIHQLLTTRSIQLPSLQLSIFQLGLLSPPYQLQTISPAALLTELSSTFTIACDIFAAVDAAWIELEKKLIHAHKSLIDLQQLAEKLQVPMVPGLVTAQTNFTHLQLEIDRDPLGIDLSLTQDLLPLIDRTQRELTNLAHQNQQIQTTFASAHQRLQQLKTIDRDASTAYTESQAKIVDHLPIISSIPPTEILAIEQWLDRLMTTYKSGTISAVQVGLTNCLSRIEVYTTTAQSALAANRLPLATRQELRGRLDVFIAKALAQGKAEDPLLADLAIQARQVLYTSPTDLDLGTDLVKRYEQRLNQC